MVPGGLPSISRSPTDAGRATYLKIASILICCLFVIIVTPSPSWSISRRNADASIPRLQVGELYALVVGLSRFKDPRIPRLERADKDARAFGEFLETQKRVFKKTRVTYLINEQATKASVEKYLYYTLPKAGKHDTIILYFSGHGSYDPMRPKEFLFLPYGAEPDYLGTTAVKMSGLEFLKGIEAERVLIIADACHAGGFSQMKPKSPSQSLKLFLHEAHNSSGRAIITSGKDEQLSWELPNLKLSVFTYNLIEGLNGKADRDLDGVVTLNEAYEYTYGKTKDETAGHQHPQFEGRVVGAFPLSYVGPSLPISELRKRVLDAARSGDIGKMKQLLRAGVGVNTRNEENETPLIIAARHGKTPIVKLLLNKGADIEAASNSRVTALTAACRNGHSEAAELLLKEGAKLNIKEDDGLSPLALACQHGHLKLAKILLDKGADIRTRTKEGKTALILAAAGGHLDLVNLLLERGANIGTRDLSGSTALTEAARRGRRNVVQFLLKKGAAISARHGGVLEDRLMLAIMRDDLGRLKELLLQGANVNAETTSDDTALSLAAGLGRLNILRLLLARGARADFVTRDGLTLLMCAASTGNTPVLKVLLDGGSDAEARDSHGNTALMLAACNGYAAAVKTLTGHRADIHARNRDGRTALMMAAEKGNLDAVRTLISA
ncbi:MAG: ankyrin repeat domain-containing protein, partial [Deltaproteobacteria bacterium]